MKYLFLTLAYIFVSFQIHAQTNPKDSIAKAKFLEEQKQISRSFNAYFNSRISTLYGAEEQVFIQKIDSLRNTFINPLNHLKNSNPEIGNAFFEEQYTDLNYTFDKFILDYIPVHKRITGNLTTLSSGTKHRLEQINTNNPSLLKYKAFRQYLQSVLEQQLDQELQYNRNKYKNSDNQRLDAGLKTIKQIFKNPEIRNQMSYELLYQHIDNYGVKNIAQQVALFDKSNIDQNLKTKIDSLYRDGLEGRKGHLIVPYKTIGKTILDLHIFQPKDNQLQHPTIVFFHGGGWSEGMPDWFFYTCQEYAKKGWVAVAVEYRLRNRQGTLPPDAIADGKSAIRYLRTHAHRLQIDANKIVASGNSAGANLALTLAVIDTLDEKNENQKISSVPNAIMLNSVATDLTQGDFWQQYFTDKEFLKRISPLHQLRKNLPPILILQGNKDNNVPLQPVIDFANKMKALGNDCELHILDGAGHFIWYDRRFGKQVNEYRESFLTRLGY
ncbi:alpha/beta hydrolase [Pedobacter sp. ASV28]|uniref:alpha/beta hydrolase n=1 Tax=Pedobacter sp. ASV28 TaxID=2795123 RepID=UPI0018EC3173|nr:alpha/beta hydrolase [Pedobacter sp. ASV28]